MIYFIIFFYIIFGLGFTTGLCSSKENEVSRYYLAMLWLAGLVSWPLGLGLFIGSWVSKYWIAQNVPMSTCTKTDKILDTHLCNLHKRPNFVKNKSFGKAKNL